MVVFALRVSPLEPALLKNALRDPLESCRSCHPYPSPHQGLVWGGGLQPALLWVLETRATHGEVCCWGGREHLVASLPSALETRLPLDQKAAFQKRRCCAWLLGASVATGPLAGWLAMAKDWGNGTSRQGQVAGMSSVL